MTAELPPPPFPGTNLLVPLRTGADIKHAAQEFRNCLNSLLQDAVTGRIAFYVWQGKEPAVVSVKPLGQIGWMVDDIKGPKNTRISTLTRRQISAEVSAWGCFPDDKTEDALRKWQADFALEQFTQVADVLGDTRVSIVRVDAILHLNQDGRALGAVFPIGTRPLKP